MHLRISRLAAVVLLWAVAIWFTIGVPASLGNNDGVGLFIAQVQAQDKNKTDPNAKVDAAAKKLIAAYGSYRQGLYKIAATQFTGFLKDNRKHAEASNARFALAICHWKLKEYEKAAALLRQCIGDKSFKRHAEAWTYLGHCQLAAGKLDKAGDAFANVIKQYPKDAQVPAASYFLAWTHQKRKQFPQAEAALTRLLKEHPNSPYQMDAVVLLGQSLQQQGKFVAAAAQFKQMIQLAPAARQPEAHYSLGVVLYRAKKYTEAAKSLSVVTSQYKNSNYAAPGLFYLGLSYFEAGKTNDARKIFQTVAKKDPKRAATAKYWLAQCELAEKHYDKALVLLNDLSKQKPAPANLEQIDFDRAACSVYLKQYAEAAKAFGQFRQRHPKSANIADATYQQAFSLHQLKQYEPSLTLCVQLNKQAGKSKEISHQSLYLTAENQFLLGRYDQADTAYANLAKTVTDSPKLHRIAYRRGQCAYHSGDFESAVELLSPLSADPKVAKDPLLREAIFLHGDASLLLGRHKNAITALNRYLKVTGNKSARRYEARYKLALAQLQTHDKAGAENNLRQVIGGPTDSPIVQNALFEYGQLQFSNNKRPEAQQALRKLLGLKVSDEVAAPSRYLLARIDFDAGKFEAAAKQFGELAAKHPKHPRAADALYEQGVCLFQAGKVDGALAPLQSYAKAYPTGKHIHPVRYLTAKTLTKLNRPKEAMPILTSLANNPKARTENILYDLAWAQRAAKDQPAAEKTYQRLLSEFPNSKLATTGRVEMADSLRQQKKFSEAVKLLEKALADMNADKSADPQVKATANYYLALCYLELKQASKAAPLFARFADQNPKAPARPYALYQAGNLYGQLGKVSESQKYLAKVTKDYPKSEYCSAAYLTMGQVQSDADLFKQSADTFKQYLSRYSKDKLAYRAYFGLGWAYENQKNFDEARKSYTKVIDIHNGETAARAQFQIGETYFKQGRFEDAARELVSVDSVYRYEKWSSKALYEAGQAFEKLKQMDNARKMYDQCVKKYAKTKEAQLASIRIKQLN